MRPRHDGMHARFSFPNSCTHGITLSFSHLECKTAKLTSGEALPGKPTTVIARSPLRNRSMSSATKGASARWACFFRALSDCACGLRSVRGALAAIRRAARVQSPAQRLYGSGLPVETSKNDPAQLARS